jgi:hypothetical protein
VTGQAEQEGQTSTKVVYNDREVTEEDKTGGDDGEVTEEDKTGGVAQ